MDTQESYKVSEVVLAQETDALRVIDAMERRVKRYGCISVEDFYSLVGVEATFSDARWGWRALDNVTTSYHRGWTLNLPAPQPL